MRVSIKKILLTVCSVAALSFVCTAQAQETDETFSDVPESHWASEQIEYFVQRGIVNGYGDGTFRPAEGVTREEFCKMLVTTFDQPLGESETTTFADVPSSRWSYPYIELCREFLTGYINPFGGQPYFHPSEDATREDIAVALVKMMGYTAQEASGETYALQKFQDGAEISPGLVGYVSIACEKGLINGYPDGTFGPTKGISRAETVVLLNRATKQAVTDISAELNAEAELLYSKDGKTVSVHITTETGATASVNGQAVSLGDNGYQEYEGNYQYVFDSEGTKEFTVVVKKSGKSKTIDLTAEYQVEAPELKITTCPETSEEETVTVSGTVTDPYGVPTLTLNGSTVKVKADGSWSVSYTLTEGDNTLVFVASNLYGKEATKEKTIVLEASTLALNISNCPEAVTEKTVTITGSIKSNDSDVYLTINGEEVRINSDFTWSKSVTLQDGKNKFTFLASNSRGKSVTEKRTITYDAGEMYYAIVLDNCSMGKDENGTYFWIDLGFCDGTECKVKCYQSNVSDFQEGDIVAFNLNDDGLATEMRRISCNSAAIQEINGECVRFHGINHVYEITDDTAILYVDYQDLEIGGGRLKVAYESESGDYIDNVLYYDEDGDRALEVLVVDVNNDLYGVR